MLSKPAKLILRPSEIGRALPPSSPIFEVPPDIVTLEKYNCLQQICQQQKIKAKSRVASFNNLQNKQLRLHSHFSLQSKHVSNFNSALFFINTNFTQSIHFYIYGIRKTLDSREICLVFTKNNIFMKKMNN